MSMNKCLTVTLVLLAGCQLLAAERPCWTRKSVMFLDAPTFEFSANAAKDVRYRTDVLSADGKLRRLYTDTARVTLTNCWDQLPTGFVSVTCTAVGTGGDKSETLAGARVFWKSAPFAGDSRPRPRSFADGARAALAHVLDAASSRYLLEHGTGLLQGQRNEDQSPQGRHRSGHRPVD